MSTEELSPQLKFFVGAVCTIVFEFCCGHILEIFKIKRQTTDKSMNEIYHLLTDKKGLFGIWDGFIPWGFLMSLCKGASFSYGHQLAYNSLISLSIVTSYLSLKSIDIISSGLGGFFQGIVMSPLLLLKTRVITHDKFRNISGGVGATIIASFKIGYEIITEQGIMALTKGMRVFSFKRFCDWITRFLFVEMTMTFILVLFSINCKQSVIWSTIAGLIGGTLSALVTAILDVMTALIQDAAKANDENVGFMSLIKMMFKDKAGFEKIGKGLYLRIWHVALTTVVMKNSVPFVCNLVLKWQGAQIKREGDEL